jgi:spermidine/putrescine transport system substrate-binding protein
MSRIILAVLVLTSLLACTKKESPTVNLAIWGNYLTPAMQEKFEKESGVKLRLSSYSSNEELLAKIQMGSSGLDVAVPSDYMVNILIKMNLLEPLTMADLPNSAGIDDSFLKQSFDPENKFSLPYSWTTTGIAVNKDLYKDSIRGWKDLLANPALDGKYALLDDVRETTGAALKLDGASVNTVAPADLKKARQTLLGSKKTVKMFTSDTIDILKNKEVAAAQAYSSDALQAASKSGGKIEYILPAEGSTMAIDNLVLIKGGKNPAAALKLINFLLSQESEKDRVQNVMTGPILKGTKALLSPELQQNKALFPAADVRRRLEAIHDLGKDNHLYEELWTEVKTAR